LPGKNYKLLVDKPLVQYALEAGIDSRYLDDVVISSDCDICIGIARDQGVNVPFKRPVYLAGDKVGSADVISHVIEHLEKQGSHFDFFVLLEPTSPLRDASDVDAALELLVKSGHTALVSVCQAEDQHPSFMFKILDDGKLVSWSGDKFVPLRRQEIQPTYYLDGSIYISDVEVFLDKRTFCHEKTGAYIVPKWKAYEVDDIWDFICIEAIMKYRQENSEVKYE
jgi:CMP-N,N'-diacetyllegionaminic acid synthase